LIVMCGYSKIIGQEILQLPLEGCINLHASKLPRYRGAAPLNWALINGEKEIGLSIYKVDRGIDTGDIYAQETFEVSEDFTIRDALDKTLKIYPRMLLEVCDKIENGTIYPISQDPNEGTYFTKRRPKDGEFNWASDTAEQVHNKTRALTHPYPGAFFIHNGKKYFVWKSNLERKNYYGIPGRVAARHSDGGVTVIAKDRGVRLTKVQEQEQDEKPARDLFKTGEDLI